MRKKLNKNTSLLLIIALTVGAVLRLCFLGSIPPHLSPDEASLGYNAYSILKTGKDEHGVILPLIFKSFGDYKPGAYIYVAVPFVQFFGLTETAVRLPSAIAGIVAIALVYLICFELSKNRELSLFCAFFLSLNPWHIIFSRGAWEANLSLTFTLAGIYFFLASLKKERLIFLSALFFGLTFITYQGSKLSTAIVLVILSLQNYKDILKFNKRNLTIAAIIGFFLTLPVILSILYGEVGRLTVFSVFSYKRLDEYLLPFLSQANEKKDSFVYYIFHSEQYSLLRGILGRYFNHFSGRFLFIEGDWQNPRHSIPYHGMLTLADFPLLIIGIVSIIRGWKTKFAMFFTLWLFLAPFPSVLSRDQVHAIRSLHMLIPLVIIIAYGGYTLWRRQKILVLFFAPLYCLSYIYFLDAYFIHMPRAYSEYWDYGYKQIVETVTPLQNQFKTIRIQQSYSQPYIYFLFYRQYDPKLFQEKNPWIPGESKLDVGKVEHLDNIYFGPIDWSLNRGNTDTLFVADTVRMPVVDSSDPKEFILHREITFLNGKTAFRIVSVRKPEQ